MILANLRSEPYLWTNLAMNGSWTSKSLVQDQSHFLIYDTYDNNNTSNSNSNNHDDTTDNPLSRSAIPSTMCGFTKGLLTTNHKKLARYLLNKLFLGWFNGNLRETMVNHALKLTYVINIVKHLGAATCITISICEVSSDCCVWHHHKFQVISWGSTFGAQKPQHSEWPNHLQSPGPTNRKITHRAFSESSAGASHGAFSLGNAPIFAPAPPFNGPPWAKRC